MNRMLFWTLVLNAWNVGVQTMGFVVDVASNDVGLLTIIFMCSLVLSVVILVRHYPRSTDA